MKLHLKLQGIFQRKEWKFRLFLFSSFILMFVIIIISSQNAFTLYKKIRQKLPHPFHQNPVVHLQVPSNDLNKYAVGTNVYLYQPKLVLVGYVVGIEESSNQLQVSIVEEHQEVLKQDTLFKLIYEAPSFYQLLQRALVQNEKNQYLFSCDDLSVMGMNSGELGAKLKNHLASNGISLSNTASILSLKHDHAWQIQDQDDSYTIKLAQQEFRVYGSREQFVASIYHYQKAQYSEIFDVWREELARRGIEPQKAQEIVSDSFVRERLFAALNNEIVQKIDFEHAFRQIPTSPETQKLLEELRVDNVVFSLADGFVDGGNQGFEHFVTDQFSGYESPSFLGRSAQRFYGLISLAKNRELFWEEVWPEARNRAVELGWKESIRSVQEVVSNNPDEVSSVATKVVIDMKLEGKIGQGLQVILLDQKLRDYIQKRWGKETLLAFQQSTVALSQHPTTQDVLSTMKKRMESYLANVSTQILLSDDQQSIHPAFLNFVREKLLGYKEPQILCEPGSGSNVPSGHVYSSQQVRSVRTGG